MIMMAKRKWYKLRDTYKVSACVGEKVMEPLGEMNLKDSRLFLIKLKVGNGRSNTSLSNFFEGLSSLLYV